MSTPPQPSSAGRKKRLILILTIVAYVAVLFLALRTVDFGQTLSVLGSINLNHLMWIIALIAVHLGLRAIRYHYLVLMTEPSGYRFHDGVRIFFAGVSAAVVTPARAGDVIKAEMLHAYGIRRSTALSLVFIERNLDLMVIVASIVLCGIIIFYGQNIHVESFILSGVLIFLTLIFLTVMVTLPLVRKWTVRAVKALGHRFTGKNFGEVINRLFDVWDDIFRSPASLLKFSSFTVAAWIADFSKLWVLLDGTGVDITLTVVLFVYPISLMAGILSLIPISEGVFGVTSVLLLNRIAGVDISLATACVVVDRGLSVLAPVVLYPLFLRSGWIRSRAPDSK